MNDVANSVLSRLKNRANESGRSFQLCLQLFCEEEFLRRLEKSRYCDNFVLKGGLFLYSITGFDGRVTIDVDFLLRRLPNTPTEMKAIIEEIVSSPSENDFVFFELIGITPISLARKYSGLSASLLVRIKNTKTPISIDFGFGDVIFPQSEKRLMPTQLSGFRSPTINTYSLETVVAEKLDAILDLMEYSSRMKDYYDLFHISNKFDFDGKALVKAIKKTMENRARDFSLERFLEAMNFASDEFMNEKWNNFLRKTNMHCDSFECVMKRIKMFLEKPFSYAISNLDLFERWSSVNGYWLAIEENRK